MNRKRESEILIKKGVKRCLICQNIKPRTEVHFRLYINKKRNAFVPICIPCHIKKQETKKEERKLYYANNREKILASVKKAYQENIKQRRLISRNRNRKARDTVFSFYGYVCRCCGETNKEFLAIDHINGNGLAHRKKVNPSGGGSVLYHWIIKNNFPNDLQVLCHNCNCAKGFYGYCPHEKSLNNLIPKVIIRDIIPPKKSGLSNLRTAGCQQ